MHIVFADNEHFVIATAGGLAVSESFTDLLQAEAVLILLIACGIKEEDLRLPRHAAYTSTIAGVEIGFREEWSRNLIWLVREPAWIAILKALNLNWNDISIVTHPRFGETVAIKRESLCT